MDWSWRSGEVREALKKVLQISWINTHKLLKRSVAASSWCRICSLLPYQHSAGVSEGTAWAMYRRKAERAACKKYHKWQLQKLKGFACFPESGLSNSGTPVTQPTPHWWMKRPLIWNPYTRISLKPNSSEVDKWWRKRSERKDESCRSFKLLIPIHSSNRAEPEFSKSCYIHPKPLRGQTARTHITPENVIHIALQELGLHAYTGLTHVLLS